MSAHYVHCLYSNGPRKVVPWKQILGSTQTATLEAVCSVFILFAIKATNVLIDFLFTVKAATLKFIFGCGSAISPAKEGKSGFISNLVKS